MARAEEQRLTVVGLNRFGLGARPGDLSGIGSNIREALLQEVVSKTTAVPAMENLLSSAEAFRRLKAERDAVKSLQDKNPASADAKKASPDPQATREDVKNPPRRVVREIFQAETVARLEAAKQAPTGFAERMVLFWSNHFCISARKAEAVRVMAGAYEREAIRPHVFGRFEDMLLAAEKHPAMLVYLDNEQSIGPGSRGGQRQRKGLNENLAREIMELHTLGVDGGYTQDDVTSFARVLTGWRFARQASPFGEEGHFVFNPNLHEPGNHTIMGVVYRDDGVRQGEAALLALAKHPSTARHIAQKLATHFVSDRPSEALVSRLETTFRKTQGDLSAVSRALIEAPEAWSAIDVSDLKCPRMQAPSEESR